MLVSGLALVPLTDCARRPQIEVGPVSAQVAMARGEAEQRAGEVAEERARVAAGERALAEVSRALHGGVAASDTAARAVPPKPPGSVVLLGDSMAWAIAVELEPLMAEDGHPFRFEYKVSDSVRAWKSSKARPLRDALKKHDADIVIIVLGSNDYFFPRSETLQSVLDRTNELVGERACYWVGPPMWTEDRGIVNFLAENLAPCAFFNSSELDLERRSDGIHPNRAGSRAWAKAVYDWIKANPRRDHPPGETYHP